MALKEPKTGALCQRYICSTAPELLHQAE